MEYSGYPYARQAIRDIFFCSLKFRGQIDRPHYNKVDCSKISSNKLSLLSHIIYIWSTFSRVVSTAHTVQTDWLMFITVRLVDCSASLLVEGLANIFLFDEKSRRTIVPSVPRERI